MTSHMPPQEYALCLVVAAACCHEKAAERFHHEAVADRHAFSYNMSCSRDLRSPPGLSLSTATKEAGGGKRAGIRTASLLL
jgi:hypothetical protein